MSSRFESGRADIISVGADYLRGLTDQDIQINYDANDNISLIEINTKDSDGNPITITLEFEYYPDGKLKRIRTMFPRDNY